jgi:hypothetical protein
MYYTVSVIYLRDISCNVHVMRYVLPLKLTDITSSKRHVTDHIAMFSYP